MLKLSNTIDVAETSLTPLDLMYSKHTWYKADRVEDEEYSEAHKDTEVLRCTNFQGRNRDTDIGNGHG